MTDTSFVGYRHCDKYLETGRHFKPACPRSFLFSHARHLDASCWSCLLPLLDLNHLRYRGADSGITRSRLGGAGIFIKTPSISFRRSAGTLDAAAWNKRPWVPNTSAEVHDRAKFNNSAFALRDA